MFYDVVQDYNELFDRSYLISDIKLCYSDRIEGHELLGHARSLAVGRGRDNQKIDAIQVENLILRVMGINHINNGNNHAPGNIIIQNPTDLPVFR